MRSRGVRPSKRIEAKAQSHDAERCFLAALPLNSKIGRVVSHPAFNKLPEQFGIFFILRARVCAAKSKDPTESAWFPPQLNVPPGKLINCRPVAARRGLSGVRIAVPLRWE